ncbi:hypothetical protein ACFLTE_07195 [Bacteroidota bacterium]
MKKLLCFCLIGVTILSSVYNQASNQKNNRLFNPHFLGVNAGFSTGIGFSYRYFPETRGYQVTCLPLLDKDNTYFSLGVTYLSEITEYKQSRLLLFVSNHISNFDDVVNNIGVGFGTDTQMENLIVNCMIGYGLLDMFNDIKARPIIEFGAFYSF